MYSTKREEFVAYFSIILSFVIKSITNITMLNRKEIKRRKPRNPLFPFSLSLNWGKNFMVTPLSPKGKIVPNKVAVEYNILVKPISSGDNIAGCKIKTLTKPITIPT
jgi:hypothetical protein